MASPSENVHSDAHTPGHACETVGARQRYGAVAANFVAGFGAAMVSYGILSPLLYKPPLTAYTPHTPPYKGISDVLRRHSARILRWSAARAKGVAPKYGFQFALKDALRTNWAIGGTQASNALPGTREHAATGLLALSGRNVSAGATSAVVIETLRFPIATLRVLAQRRALAGDDSAPHVPGNASAGLKHEGSGSVLRDIQARGGLIGLYRSDGGSLACFRASLIKVAVLRGVQFGMYDTAKDAGMSGTLAACGAALAASTCGEWAAVPWHYVLIQASLRNETVTTLVRRLLERKPLGRWITVVRPVQVLEGAVLLIAYDSMQALVGNIGAQK